MENKHNVMDFVEFLELYLLDTVLVQAAGTVTTSPGIIRKLCVVYLEKYVVLIGHDFHFFGSWKILLEKVWSPCKLEGMIMSGEEDGYRQ